MLEQNDAALAPAENASMDIDAALSEAWDNQQPEEITAEPEQEPEQVEATDSETDTPEAVEQPEPEPAAVELPSDLPVALKEHWGAIPDTAREAIERAHREMAQKVGDKTRELQRMEYESEGLSPIKNELTLVAQEFPAFSHMKPHEVAAEMRQLAQYGQKIQEDPVNALAFLAQEYGVVETLGQMFSGQVPTENNTPALLNEISSLKRQLAAASDPQTQRQHFDQWSSERQALDAVQNFVGSAEYWSEVEQYMPNFIPVAQQQLGESAAPEAVLEAAYNMAITTLMPEKAPQPKVASEATPEPDPAKVEQALKAKSVNVSGRTTGKPRKMTLEEELAAIHDRAQN